MKAMTCEMCGDNNLIKMEGLFVCQSCRTKYSVEEARKMMIDGVVEIAGTVKVDISDRLNNLYQIARRAKDENNSENAAKYYDMILVEDPSSWEASFYSVYFKAMSCTIAQIQSAAISITNNLITVINLISENIIEEPLQEKAVNEVFLRSTAIANMLHNGAANHYNEISGEIRNKFTQQYLYNVSSTVDLLYTLGNQIEMRFESNDNLNKLASEAWKLGITKQISYFNLIAEKETNKKTIMSFAERIKKYDPTYVEPKLITSACYIATAVYGSYDCPQVWMLRRYRDDVLSKNIYGRSFIRIYYAISPQLVKWFGHTDWIKEIWKVELDRFVSYLQTIGIQGTPYVDKTEL